MIVSRSMLVLAFGMCVPLAPLLGQGAVHTTDAPTIFAPGVISGPANDGAPAFMPDGKSLYFGRAGASWGFIMESHLIAGQWTPPEAAPFSGLWSDSQPSVSPDGSYLIFQSLRPIGPVSPDTTDKRPGVSRLWKVRRTASGWSEPEPLPETVNFTPLVFKPSIAADGTLYFMARVTTDKSWRLHRSRFAKGTYTRAEPLSFSDGTHTDVDPAIAADQSFLIFSSAGRAAATDAHEHLYITFGDGDSWGAITPLRYVGDYEDGPADDGEAQLSPDGRALYFTSNRTVRISRTRTREQAAQDFARLNAWDNSNNNPWSISLAPWLEQVRSNGPARH